MNIHVLTRMIIRLNLVQTDIAIALLVPKIIPQTSEKPIGKLALKRLEELFIQLNICRNSNSLLLTLRFAHESCFIIID